MCIYDSCEYLVQHTISIFSPQIGESVEVQEQDTGDNIQQEGDGQEREQDLQQWLEEDEDRRRDF